MLSQRRWMTWVAVAGLATAFAPAAAALSLAVHPLATRVAAGDPVTVEIVVSDLGSDVVGGYSLTLNHDPSLLSPVSVTFGAALGLVGVQQLFTPVPPLPPATPGAIDLASVSLLSEPALQGLQGDPVTLVTLQFATLAEGNALLSLSDVTLTDGQGLALPISEILGGVVLVPEPGTLLCVCVGLGLLGLARRR
jgi:hypothetical protein